MDRQSVLLFMNNSVHYGGYGSISWEDARMFSSLIEKRTGEKMEPNTILEAALNSTPEMLEKYKSGMYHSLIKDFNLIVEVMNGVNINGGEKIIGYK